MRDIQNFDLFVSKFWFPGQKQCLVYKKIEGVTEYFEIIKNVKSVNLKRKISANSALKNSY